MAESDTQPLTPAMRSTIEMHLAAWDHRIRSTSRADRSAVQAAMCRMYKRCGVPEPQVFVWMSSPIGAQFAADLLCADPTPPKFRTRVSEDQRGIYRRDVESQVEPEFWLKPRLDAPELADWATGRPPTAAYEHMGSHSYLADLDKLRSIYDAPWLPLSLRGEADAARTYESQGQQQTLSGWISVFAERRIGVSSPRFFNSTLCSRFGRPVAASRNPRFGTHHVDHGGWDLRRWTMFELFGDAVALAHAADIATVVEATSYIEALPDVAVLAENPVVYATDKDGMLHNAAGPAVRFSDGVEVYSWRGRWVDRDVIEQPVSLEAIVTERNAEVRRCLIERWGWDTFVRKAHLQPIGPEVEDPGNAPHTLQLFEIPERLQLSPRNPVRLLMCTNGSSERDGTRRRYGLLVRAVHSDPVDAAAELYGVSPKTYRRMQVRT